MHNKTEYLYHKQDIYGMKAYLDTIKDGFMSRKTTAQIRRTQLY